MNTEKFAALVTDRPLQDVLSEKYLAYALSTIMARSLPDVRDGLKPVHRRLIYAMRQLLLRPDAMTKKSARIVGDVMGKFHPHGDASIYDALVRLAQDFAVRYPLIFGQGNFGNIDGDNPAAMRYTEAKLTQVAEYLLEDIESDTVDFQTTYDNENQEPLVLPAAFPNLLANGASGIAVGMACNIPPHNVAEICQALEHLIANPKASVAELVAFMPGPDFPTGGIIVEPPQNILTAYETGRGAFRLRARWHEEKLPQGQYQLVVTEIPYQVSKSPLIEKIANMLQDKKLPLLEDIIDESTDKVRLVLVPKSRNVEPSLLMESLFRGTDLEIKFSLNMNVLDKNRTPHVMSLRQVLQAFLDHRHDVLVRRSEHRLGRIAERLETLGGLLIAYLNLDEVIKIIRDEDEPKPVMIKRFGLTDNQVEAILNMRLRQLRKLEEIAITKERDGLSGEQAELQDLLGNEKKRWKNIKEQIKAVGAAYGPKNPYGPRRTTFASAPAIALANASFVVPVEKEPVTILISAQGWVRTTKGHLADTADQKYKEGDEGQYALHAQSTDRLVVLSTDGRSYGIAVDKLPKGRGFGDPLRLMVQMADTANVLYAGVLDATQKFLIASSDGRGFVLPMAEMDTNMKAGKNMMTLPAGVVVQSIQPIASNATHVAVVGQNRKLLVFPLADLPEMSKGRGVMLQKYKDGGLSDAMTFNLKDGLQWQVRGKTTTEKNVALWVGERAQAGRIAPTGFAKDNKFGG